MYLKHLQVVATLCGIETYTHNGETYNTADDIDTVRRTCSKKIADCFEKALFEMHLNDDQLKSIFNQLYIRSHIFAGCKGA